MTDYINLEQFAIEQQHIILECFKNLDRKRLIETFPNFQEGIDLIDALIAIGNFDDEKINKLISCLNSDNRNRLSKEFPEINDKLLIIEILKGILNK